MLRNGLVSIKKADLILIAAAFAAAVLFFGLRQWTVKEGNQVLVTVDGKEYGTYSLAEPRRQEITGQMAGQAWRNLLVIENGQAHMEEADCRDLICVHHAPISKAGETIICLPHKLVITVENTTGPDNTPEFDGVTR